MPHDKTPQDSNTPPDKTSPAKPRRRHPWAAWYRYYYVRSRRFVVEHVLHADDPPHKLALGAAIGIFVAVTPTPGLQMWLTFVLAWLCRANKIVGLPMAWVSNPFTSLPILWITYEIGRILLMTEPVGIEWWKELAAPPEGWWAGLTFYWTKFAEIAGPLWVGSIIFGLLLAIPTYVVVYFGVRWKRLHKFGMVMPPTGGFLALARRNAAKARADAAAAKLGLGEPAPDVVTRPERPRSREASRVQPPKVPTPNSTGDAA